jgi:small subunit ribosomal protein S16
MLMIRFQRIGRTNDPAFRIVVLEKERAAKAGNIVEQLGSYNPKTKALSLKAESIKQWIAQGAQPTDSIRNLLITQKVIEGKKVNVLPKKLLEKKPEEIIAAPETAPAAPVANSVAAEASTAEVLPPEESVANEAPAAEVPVV